MKKEDLKVGVKYDIVDPTDSRYHFEGVTFNGFQYDGGEHAVFVQGEGKEDLWILSGFINNKDLTITESI